MRRLRAGLLAALMGLSVGVASLAAPAPAAAQDDDDWEVTRNPFDPRVIAGYKAILAKNPNDAAALRKLSALYQRYSSLDKLLAEYEAKLKAGPQFADVMVVGHLLRNRGDLAGAVARYEQAATLRPTDPAVHLALAELYRQTQRPAEALAAYERALPLTQGKQDKKVRRSTLKAMADLALEAKDIEKARAYYAEIVALDPRDLGARLELAEALAKHKLHAEALEVYRAAEAQLGSDPARRAQVLTRIGMEEEALGHPDLALAAYAKAMSLTPRGHYLRRELTTRVVAIYRARDDIRGLIALYEKQWGAGSRGFFEWDTLARLYEEAGEQDKALAAFKAAVRAAPYELDTQASYIQMLKRAGRDTEALAQYEVVIRVAPGESRFQLELAAWVFDRGDRARALALAQKVAARFPDDAGVHMSLAELYARWGEDALSLKAYELLARLEPEDETHLVDLGEQYFQRGDKGRAIELWKKIITKKTPQNLARLGDVYAEHDMGVDAKYCYDAAIALAPKDPVLYRGRAAVHERFQRTREAVDDWEKVIALTQGVAAQRALRREARTRLIAVLYRDRGRNGRGDTLGERVRRADQAAQRGDVDEAMLAAEGYVRLGQPDNAEVVLTRLLPQAVAAKDDELEIEARLLLVTVARSLGKLDDAIAQLKLLVDKDGKRAREFYAKMSEIELSRYNDRAALEYADLALKASPKDPTAQARLAAIYEAQGDLDEAARRYALAIELAPRDFPLYFELARLELRRQHPDVAVKLYRDVIKQATDEDLVQRAALKAIDLEEYLGSLGDLERELSPMVFTYGVKPVYRGILVSLYGRYVPSLAARVRRGDASARRELAAIADRGLRPLLDALADEDLVGEKRRAAVTALGALGNPAAARPLIKLALTEPPPRPLAIGGGGGGPSGGRAMLNDTEGPSLDLRAAAIIAAGQLGAPGLVAELATLARHDDRGLREAAVWALGRSTDARALPVLIAALTDPQPSVQAIAALGLGRSSDRRARDELVRRLAAPGTTADVRAACVYALGLRRGGDVQAPLAAALDDGSMRVRRLAAWALGASGTCGARGQLLTAYPASDDDTRRVIEWALGESCRRGDAVVPDELVRIEGGRVDLRLLIDHLGGELPAVTVDPLLLVDQVPALVGGLGRALDRQGDPAERSLRDLDASATGLALGTLTAGLGELAPERRAVVEGALRQVVDGVSATLLKLAASGDPRLRLLALSVLAKAGHAEAPALLAAAFADERAPLRLAALDIAARPGAGLLPAARAELARAAEQRTAPTAWEERRALVAVIALADDAPAERALIAALADPSAFVREAAVTALASRAGEGATTAIITASRDAVPEVRIAAATALRSRSTQPARARLTELAHDDDARVRRAAAPPP